MGCMLVMIELVEVLLTGLGTGPLISGMEGERVEEGICRSGSLDARGAGVIDVVWVTVIDKSTIPGRDRRGLGDESECSPSCRCQTSFLTKLRDVSWHNNDQEEG